MNKQLLQIELQRYQDSYATSVEFDLSEYAEMPEIFSSCLEHTNINEHINQHPFLQLTEHQRGLIETCNQYAIIEAFRIYLENLEIVEAFIKEPEEAI